MLENLPFCFVGQTFMKFWHDAHYLIMVNHHYAIWYAIDSAFHITGLYIASTS